MPGETAWGPWTRRGGGGTTRGARDAEGHAGGKRVSAGDAVGGRADHDRAVAPGSMSVLRFGRADRLRAPQRARHDLARVARELGPRGDALELGELRSAARLVE